MKKTLVILLVTTGLAAAFVLGTFVHTTITIELRPRLVQLQVTDRE